MAAAGTGPGGLIPEAAVAGLLGERDRVAAAMTSRVGQVGRAVSQRIQGYEVVVNDALRLLADQGLCRWRIWTARRRRRRAWKGVWTRRGSGPR